MPLFPCCCGWPGKKKKKANGGGNSDDMPIDIGQPHSPSAEENNSLDSNRSHKSVDSDYAAVQWMRIRTSGLDKNNTTVAVSSTPSRQIELDEEALQLWKSKGRGQKQKPQRTASSSSSLSPQRLSSHNAQASTIELKRGTASSFPPPSSCPRSDRSIVASFSLSEVFIDPDAIEKSAVETFSPIGLSRSSPPSGHRSSVTSMPSTPASSSLDKQLISTRNSFSPSSPVDKQVKTGRASSSPDMLTIRKASTTGSAPALQSSLLSSSPTYIPATRMSHSIDSSDPYLQRSKQSTKQKTRVSAIENVRKNGSTGYPKEPKKEAVAVARFVGQDIPFYILGVTPDVKVGALTPPLMEALREFVPLPVLRNNFFLKFSMLRDPRSVTNLVSRVKSSPHTILAVETKDGFVFGAYCSTPWQIHTAWFGNTDSFLWRLKHPRLNNGTSNNRCFDHDSEIEVYPVVQNTRIMYCDGQMLALGGGEWAKGDRTGAVHTTTDNNDVCPYPQEPTGIGITIDSDLKGGETKSCSTFYNPCLGKRKGDKEFKIRFLEVWALTPGITVDEAESLEMQFNTPVINNGIASREGATN